MLWSANVVKKKAAFALLDCTVVPLIIDVCCRCQAAIQLLRHHHGCRQPCAVCSPVKTIMDSWIKKQPRQGCIIPGQEDWGSEEVYTPPPLTPTTVYEGVGSANNEGVGSANNTMLWIAIVCDLQLFPFEILIRPSLSCFVLCCLAHPSLVLS
jgi:hypothetical protein